MIRFIFNFIFFGVLFYAIAHFFPDAFQTLVGWAEKIYTFFVEAAVSVIDWVSDLTKPGTKGIPSNGPDTSALFALVSTLFK
ncbi:MAG: hypothetical protein VX777_00270 [Chlamydiota bacterium]|nr:hypothetical protein [Chlamydiota bacterium]